MRILYIAPRYHTNQTAVIHGWQLHGDEVFFLARAVGPTEDHRFLVPDIIPYSPLFLAVERLYEALHQRSESAHDIGLHYGFPSPPRVRAYIREKKPDIVVLREKSVYSMICYSICRWQGIRTVIYNQTPLLLEKEKLRRGPLHRLVDRLTPARRFTPVRSLGGTENKEADPHAFFVPFIAEPMCAPGERRYMPEGVVRLLDIGRFESRKNHLLMLRVFERLRWEHPRLHLTIVGEICRVQYQEYYDAVLRFIEEHALGECVSVKKNLSTEQMAEEYRRTDLYVLPSTGEPAAISPLEAMSYSIPAVCSDGNGTADYILPGKTGDIFRDGDEEDLYEKLSAILREPERIPELGRAAYEHICRDYSFAAYYDALMTWYESDAE
ncbi:glycosyltransferase family 4 protein [Lachnoclostridium sp. Marseille-P6806]|uniref:glycosyltransferase family 4 protein n=1 Tax=Lachnoclostridium sp. Marseille-P6806 TaxID=2364793 RepID=UPI00102FD668|nr:glycosyltransferase family 4 protein [Lachnoclostridium sp. Marseille-P6806]